MESYVKKCYAFHQTGWLVMYFPSSKYEISQMATIFASGILIFPTVLLNLFATITILKCPQLKNKLCYFLILIQSVVDLGVGLFGIPLTIYYLVTPFVAFQNCAFSLGALKLCVLPSAVSIFTSCAITFERYIGVLHPYKYKTLLTKKRIKTFIFFGVVVSITVVVLSFFFAGVIATFFEFTLPFLIISTGFVYTRIYLVVRRLHRSEARPAPYPNDENRTRKKLFLREIKYAKSCFHVIVCFILSFIPPMMYSVFLKLFGPGQNFNVYFSWMLMITSLYPCVNSVMFFWSKTILRKEAIKILKACCHLPR